MLLIEFDTELSHESTVR